ncbi:MAG: tetratricopeptide repeat protein, partial [Aestuariivirga sp.]|nr:tetratricopeptide repeat protein [Aestuariivirga sp.]
HGDLLKDMYDLKRHWHLAQLINTDPLTGEAVYRGMYLWMLGYPDQAIAASNARDEHARRRGHPFDLAFALTLGAQVFELLKLPDEIERRAEEANAVGRKYGVSLFFEMMGEITLGVAWLRAGRFAEAAEQIDRGVTRLAATGHGVWLSYLRALRGEALAQLGDIAAARQVIDGSIAHIEAGEERCHYSEVLRLRGWVAECEGDADGAEALFRRAIAVAQSQEAKSWELRSTLSLAALLAGRGQAAEAHAMLAAVHGWFSEGFETHDLKAAAQLLSRLSAAI